MVKFTKEEIIDLMKDSNKIRNLSVIAHVDHGKSTLSDSLIACAGFISKERAGEERFMDSNEEEILRGITIKSSSIALCYQHKTINIKNNLKDQDGKVESFLVNLIDTPGHIDFSSEVTTALRVTDGAIVVVDCIEGMAVQTETVLKQAFIEKVVPILFVNKIDRSFLELKNTSEESYQSYLKVIQNINDLIESISNSKSFMDPTKGNVSFGSGKIGFAFTLTKMAIIYSNKFKDLTIKEIMNKFWGENYYDHEKIRMDNFKKNRRWKNIKKRIL